MFSAVGGDPRLPFEWINASKWVRVKEKRNQKPPQAFKLFQSFRRK